MLTRQTLSHPTHSLDTTAAARARPDASAEEAEAETREECDRLFAGEPTACGVQSPVPGVGLPWDGVAGVGGRYYRGASGGFDIPVFVRLFQRFG